MSVKEASVSGCLLERKGRYYVTVYYYVEGQRVTETKSTGIAVRTHKKKEAEKIKEQMILEKRKELEQSERAEKEAKSLHSVSECLERWIAYKAGRVESTTAAGYAFKLKSTVRYFSEKSMMLENLEPRDILAYYEWELAHGRQNVGKDGMTSLSRGTVCDKANLLKQFLNDAVLQNVINVNPAVSVSVPRMKEDKTKEIAFMDKEQAQSFLEYVRHEPDFEMLYYIGKLGIYYGLRRSEILGLKWDAVDFNNEEIEIRHTVVRVKHQPEHRDTVKTKASHRYLPLLEDVRNTLLELREKQKQLGIYSDDGYIFLQDDGAEYNPDRITKVFRKAVEACPADIPKNLTLHGLRHSCCGILFEGGLDMAEVQQWVGHSDIQTTANIYNHVSKRWKNEHGKRIDGLFG